MITIQDDQETNGQESVAARFRRVTYRLCKADLFPTATYSEWTDGDIDIQRDNHADECKVENENSCGKDKKCDQNPDTDKYSCKPKSPQSSTAHSKSSWRTTTLLESPQSSTTPSESPQSSTTPSESPQSSTIHL